MGQEIVAADVDIDPGADLAGVVFPRQSVTSTG